MVNNTSSLNHTMVEFIPKSLGLSGYDSYLIALLIIVLSLVVAKICYFLIGRYFKKLAAKTKSRIDDEILAIIHKPIYYIILLIGLQISVSYLLISEGFTQYSDLFSKTILIAAVILVSWVAAKMSDILMNNLGRRLAGKTKTTVDDEAIPFLSKIIKIAIYFMALMIILDQLGIEVTPLIASLGIAGFAIGFAAKDTLANLLAGFFILTDRPFVKGDRIQVGEYLGEVVDIGLRTTKIETLDHTLVIVPNEKIISTEVINYARPDLQLKVKMPVGVAYGSDPDKVKDLVLDIVNASELVLDEPSPNIFFTEFGESSLNFLLIVWVTNFKDKIRVMDEINTKLYRKFEEEEIDIPFPCRTVYLKKE